MENLLGNLFIRLGVMKLVLDCKSVISFNGIINFIGNVFFYNIEPCESMILDITKVMVIR